MPQVQCNGDLRFGHVLVRPGARQLIVDGHPAPIGARAFDVLLALAERRDRVVGKDELIDLVWPGVVVEENNLQVQISALRKLLGAQAIATVPGRGYRFALEPHGLQPKLEAAPGCVDAAPPVPPTAADGTAMSASRRIPSRTGRWLATLAAVLVLAGWAGWWLRPPPSAGTTADAVPLRSVTILPFTADDPTLAVVAAKLTLDVTRALEDARFVKVVPPPDPTAPRGSALESNASRGAGARFLLEGDLRRAGTQVEITLRLTDTKDSMQADNARATAGGATPEEVAAAFPQLAYRARAIVSQAITRAVVARGEAAADAEELVFLASAVAMRDPLATAREQRRLADAAIRVDPKLARAWALRAYAVSELFLLDFAAEPAPLLAQADADSWQAVSLDSSDPYGWSVRGYVLMLRGNQEGAFAALERAERIDPTRVVPRVVRGWVYLNGGEPRKTLASVAHLRPMVGGELDSMLAAQACAAHFQLGDVDAATVECERAETTRYSWQGQARLAAAYAVRGDTARAAQAKERLLAVAPRFTISHYEARFVPYGTPEARAQEYAHYIPALRKAGIPD